MANEQDGMYPEHYFTPDDQYLTPMFREIKGEKVAGTPCQVCGAFEQEHEKDPALVRKPKSTKTASKSTSKSTAKAKK